MARKSTAGRGAAMVEDAAVPPADGWQDEPVARGRRPRRPRSGAGGRWWVWVGRAFLWAFILVVLFNGVWQPIRSGLAQPESTEPEPTDTVDFPHTAAAAFAVRFAELYLNAAPGGANERADALAAFLPEGRASSLNLSGGELTGENIEVLAVDARDDNNAVVRLSADLNGSPVSLDVPVYAEDGGSALVVSGQPALLAAPGRAQLPDEPGVESDTDARDELEPILEGFFEAYAQTPEHLSRYLEPDAEVAALPADTVEFADLRDLTVPAATGAGSGDARQVRATVVWRLAGEGGSGELAQSYQLTVVREGENWYVRDLQGAPNSFG
ncbi:conjugal transfer protein [Marinitenerispora sediminis]|uniref:Conjugal transfer protein n=1 Tax=Marinitenerispora sediminis TaxID=1931232 RepID=A0A368TBS1_9ACTN|nr:conjugal transfer protein [Marinitenerispora sediminis]RCV54385.1 conjugal transfer protein [Marinitenerispora sediminis]RCV61114.1 conjugal transfer protein [Marinitenerispora sediminis]RCV62390.1 conjugal transfer protein [Marinitenerispora sediminis]